MVIINWHAFSANAQLKQMRCMLLFFVVLMLVMNFIMDFGQDGTVDIYGHVGGAIAGLFYGLGFFPRAKSEFGTYLRKIGFVFTCAAFTIMFGLLVTVRKPQDLASSYVVDKDN
jgi:hypothetical protein